MLYLWLVLIGGLSASSSNAADQVDQLDDLDQLDEITVTATRKKAAKRDVAKAVTVVTGSELHSGLPQVAMEALRAQPGTYFQQTTPGQGVAIIRGLKGSQVLHLVDGMRLNNAFFRNAPNQYIALINVLGGSRIETVRGTASALYGGDAIGGVVQVITPMPKFSNQGVSIRGKTYGAWSSGDLGRTLYAEIESGFEKTAWRAGVGFQRYGNRRTGAGERIAPSGYESRFGDLKLLSALGNQLKLMLSAQYMEQPSTPRIDELVAGFGQQEPSSVLYQFEPNRREFYHGQLVWIPDSSGIERIEVNLAQQTITDDRRTQATGSTIIVEEFNKSRLNGLTAQVNLIAGDQHQLIFGAEAYADTISSRRFTMPVDNETRQMVPSRFPNGSTMDSIAIYVQDEWSPLADWGVTGGLRYSHYAVVITDELTGAPLKISPDDFTANLGLRYHVSPTLTLVGNIGRGFRPPNIFDLGTLGSRPGNRFNIANVNLVPESALGIDAGLRWKTEQGFGEVFFFYTDYRDRITSVATGEQTSEGRNIVRNENAGKSTLYGVEAIVGFRLSEKLTGETVLNYTHGVQISADGTSSPDDRIPPLNGRVSTQYRINDAMLLRTDLVYAARQDRLSARDAADPRIDPDGSAGWVVLNAAIEIRGNGGFRYGIRGANIFDKRYREHGSGIDAIGRSLGLWFSFETH